MHVTSSHGINTCNLPGPFQGTQHQSFTHQYRVLVSPILSPWTLMLSSCSVGVSVIHRPIPHLLLRSSWDAVDVSCRTESCSSLGLSPLPFAHFLDLRAFIRAALSTPLIILPSLSNSPMVSLCMRRPSSRWALPASVHTWALLAYCYLHVESRTQLPIAIGFTLGHGHTKLVL